MRISGLRDDPDFWRERFPDAEYGVEIYLDGSPVEHVLAADDEAGTVEVIQYNGAYPIYAGGRYITKTLTGKVEIKPKDTPDND